MEPSKTGIEFIKKAEGLKTTPYKLGPYYHVGYGHLLGAGPFTMAELQYITEDQADQYLKEDLKKASDAVNELTTAWRTQPQHDALTSFVFNLGKKNYKDSTLRKKINSGAGLDAIEKEWNKWTYAADATGTKVIMPGLVKRRGEEFALFKSGSKRKQAIVGGSIFGGLVIIVIIILIWRWWKNRDKK